ncbi:hypothetical protein ACFXJ8_08335 [Nonomuraea sp. NPDC059194]|uniref:hypothetical protein n=1 Tax=Nonomuraea sp. NPDC059194 TaxID=3346764 RepID=UPI003675D8F0
MAGEEFLSHITTYAGADASAAEDTVWIDIPAGGVDAGAVGEALTEAGEVLRVRFASSGSPLTFYAWHDEQAGQLRLSMSRACPDALPFGGSYRPDTEPTAVAESISADVLPGVVLWEDLRSDSTEDEVDMVPFPVYVVPLGAAG